MVVVFAIHWHESAMDLHVFPILIPPHTSLPIDTQFISIILLTTWANWPLQLLCFVQDLFTFCDAALRLFLIASNRGNSLLHCAGFSLRWLLSLWGTGSGWADFSGCTSLAPESWLNSCSGHVGSSRTRDRMVSLELQDGFLTSGHQGSPAQF